MRIIPYRMDSYLIWWCTFVESLCVEKLWLSNWIVRFNTGVTICRHVTLLQCLQTIYHINYSIENVNSFKVKTFPRYTVSNIYLMLFSSFLLTTTTHICVSIVHVIVRSCTPCALMLLLLFIIAKPNKQITSPGYFPISKEFIQ